jgi:hypothetical protein
VCGVAGWFGRIVVVAGAVVVLGASGCTSDGKGPVDPPAPSSSAASVTPTPTGTVEEQILAQYRRFWTEALPAAQAAPVEKRRAILAQVVMEPALAFLVEGIRELDRAGERAYGRPVPFGETLKRRRGIALVTGCLDSSHAGRLDTASGRILTRGPRRELVLVTLKIGADSVWRIYQTGFPEDSQC